MEEDFFSPEEYIIFGYIYMNDATKIKVSILFYITCIRETKANNTTD